MTVLNRERAEQLVREQGSDIIIPDKYTSIGKRAFYYNYIHRLTSVVIPDSVTSIGESAFQDQNLKSAAIPNSVTSIGDSAFRGNDLTSVVIPDSVTSIGENAFTYNELSNVDIPDSITSIESSAFSSNRLTNLVIPDNVTSIGSYAFYNNRLKNVVFPENITKIGLEAFGNNALTSVVIPHEFPPYNFDPKVNIIRTGKDTSSTNLISEYDFLNANSIQELPLNGTDRILKYQLEEAFVSNGVSLDIVIIGNFNKDKIIGSSLGEIIDGGGGSKDILKGGKNSDAFFFTYPMGFSNGESYGFGTKQADLIKDFNTNEGDFLLVDKELFGLGNVKLKVVTGKRASKKASKSNNNFVYDDKKGLLFFNKNGQDKGWGDGGLFVKLQGAPELGASDFTVI